VSAAPHFRGEGAVFRLADDMGALVVSRAKHATCSVTFRIRRTHEELAAGRSNLPTLRACHAPVAYWWARAGKRDVGYCLDCAVATFPQAFEPGGPGEDHR
jgi:hypothetical protein